MFECQRTAVFDIRRSRRRELSRLLWRAQAWLGCGICPRRRKPVRTLTKGIEAPIAMAFGKSGVLFVANDPLGKIGSVVVYSSRGTVPVRTIKDQIERTRHPSPGTEASIYEIFAKLGFEARRACSPQRRRLITQNARRFVRKYQHS